MKTYSKRPPFCPGCGCLANFYAEDTVDNRLINNWMRFSVPMEPLWKIACLTTNK